MQCPPFVYYFLPLRVERNTSIPYKKENQMGIIAFVMQQALLNSLDLYF
jgi:hypothetical protein